MIGDLVQPTHLLLILIVALLVLGPKRLPEVGKSLGRGLRDFRDAVSNYSPDSLLQSDEPMAHAPEAAESELHRDPPASAATAQGSPREATPTSPPNGATTPPSETTSHGATTPPSEATSHGATTPPSEAASHGETTPSSANPTPNGGGTPAPAHDPAEEPTAVHHPAEPAGSATKAAHAPSTEPEPVDAEVVPDAGRASG